MQVPRAVRRAAGVTLMALLAFALNRDALPNVHRAPLRPSTLEQVNGACIHLLNRSQGLTGPGGGAVCDRATAYRHLATSMGNGLLVGLTPASRSARLNALADRGEGRHPASDRRQMRMLPGDGPIDLPAFGLSAVPMLIKLGSGAGIGLVGGLGLRRAIHRSVVGLRVVAAILSAARSFNSLRPASHQPGS